MRPALLSLLILAAPTAALAQTPWEPSATIEQAVARTIADAQPDLRYLWALDWSAFGVRGGRDVFWHLAPPRTYERTPAPPGVTRRSGWLSVGGKSGLLARHPAFQSWRLERPGFEPVDLSAGYLCTPPGTRHATHCEMEWTVVFRPDGRTEPCLPPAAPGN